MLFHSRLNVTWYYLPHQVCIVALYISYFYHFILINITQQVYVMEFIYDFRYVKMFILLMMIASISKALIIIEKQFSNITTLVFTLLLLFKYNTADSQVCNVDDFNRTAFKWRDFNYRRLTAVWYTPSQGFLAIAN